ncbi:MAG: FixH family protein [Saprospiraceae bacterium]|nr:FixH family protein [Saprospiraceae bacterium]
MKLNWGTGIALVYGSFVVLMVFAVTMASREDPGLLRKDYYKLDLEYQAHMDKKVNTVNLEAVPTVRFDAQKQQLFIDWPEGLSLKEGRLNMYRLSDERDEFSLELTPSLATSGIPAAKLGTGKWQVELDWSDPNDKTFFATSKIFINQP